MSNVCGLGKPYILLYSCRIYIREAIEFLAIKVFLFILSFSNIKLIQSCEATMNKFYIEWYILLVIYFRPIIQLTDIKLIQIFWIQFCATWPKIITMILLFIFLILSFLSFVQKDWDKLMIKIFPVFIHKQKSSNTKNYVKNSDTL